MMKATNIAKFNQLYRNKQFEAITSLANTAIMSEDDNKVKLHLRAIDAMANRRMGRLLESLEQSQDIWMEDPLQTVAESNIDCIFLSFVNYSKIDEFLKQKIMSNPTQWNYLFLSWFQNHNQMREEALDSLKRSLQVDPYFY